MDFFLGWVLGSSAGDGALSAGFAKLLNGFGKAFSAMCLFLCEHPWLWIPIGLGLLLMFVGFVKSHVDTFVAK